MSGGAPYAVSTQRFAAGNRNVNPPMFSKPSDGKSNRLLTRAARYTIG